MLEWCLHAKRTSIANLKPFSWSRHSCSGGNQAEYIVPIRLTMFAASSAAYLPGSMPYVRVSAKSRSLTPAHTIVAMNDFDSAGLELRCPYNPLPPLRELPPAVGRRGSRPPRAFLNMSPDNYDTNFFLQGLVLRSKEEDLRMISSALYEALSLWWMYRTSLRSLRRVHARIWNYRVFHYRPETRKR